jgi:hypothetical protein
VRVFENWVLRNVFKPKISEEVKGGWRKLHSDELYYDLYSLPYIIWGIKSRMMRYMGHVIHIR